MRSLAHDGRFAAVRRVLSSAALGLAVVELPARLHGASTHGAWALLGAIAGALMAPPSGASGASSASGASGACAADACARRASWACLAATSLGLAADFARVPPESLLSLCSGGGAGGFGLEALAAHLRWLPLTTAGTLAVLAGARIATRDIGGVRSAARGAAALLSIAAECLVMLALMASGSELLRAIARGAGLPWTADAMAAAMMLAMQLAFGLRRLVIAGDRARTRPHFTTPPRSW